MKVFITMCDEKTSYAVLGPCRKKCDKQRKQTKCNKQRKFHESENNYYKNWEKTLQSVAGIIKWDRIY